MTAAGRFIPQKIIKRECRKTNLAGTDKNSKKFHEKHCKYACNKDWDMVKYMSYYGRSSEAFTRHERLGGKEEKRWTY